MKEIVVNYFKQHSGYYNIEELKEVFNIDEENLISILTELEIEGILYSIYNTYTLMPENYLVGQLQTTKKGNKYIQEEDGTRIYVNKKDLNGALDFDTVIVEKFHTEKNETMSRVKKILKRTNPNIVCEVRNINGIKNLVTFNVAADINFKIDKESIKDFVDGDRIIVKISTQKQKDLYNASFVKYLCHKDDPDKEIKTIATSRGFNIAFEDDYLEEVKMIPTEVETKALEGRVDYRDELVFTVDGEHTKDIDDALSLKILPNGNYELGVHIAHVSHYVKEGTAMFRESYERGTSAYLLDYVIPMIHHKLSNGICSLNPNEDRLTRSCIMEIDKNGNIVNYKIVKSVIRSKKKMTYENVNLLFEKNIVPEGYEPFVETLKSMKELSEILTNKRDYRGSLTFASNEVNVSLDNEGRAVDFNLTNHGPAERLIENFMIAANETVASHVYWQNLPFIYRVHDCPTEITLNNTINLISDLGYRINKIKNCDDPRLLQAILHTLETYEEYPILSSLLLRSMKRAMYSTVNVGHFGLASEMYTHFTSPIRRFPDLMVHTLLDKYEYIYENGIDSRVCEELNEIEGYLKEACIHSSYKERQADLAEEESNKLKMMEYMKQYIGETFEAVILMIDSHGVTIKTDNLITGKVRFEDVLGDSYSFDSKKSRLIGQNTNEKYKIGNRISVTVKAVIPSDKEIYFYINENLSKKSNKVKVLTK